MLWKNTTRGNVLEKDVGMSALGCVGRSLCSEVSWAKVWGKQRGTKEFEIWFHFIGKLLECFKRGWNSIGFTLKYPRLLWPLCLWIRVRDHLVKDHSEVPVETLPRAWSWERADRPTGQFDVGARAERTQLWPWAFSLERGDAP